MKTWQTKGKNKCYQTSLGTTDFDIPMFGYRSAFLIIFSILIVIFLTTYICTILHVKESIPVIVTGSLSGGLSVGYSQFFIERKIGFCRQFYIITALFTLFSAILLSLVYFTGVLL